MSQSNLYKSASKILRDELPMVRKSIVIGLGGSGMRGIFSAKKYIEENMPDEARRYVRWIGIDTTDIGTSIEGRGSRYRFPGDRQFYQEEIRSLYIGAPTPAELSTDYLRQLRNEDPAYNWLPDPDVFSISTRSGQGANQTRALGRLALFANFERIRSALIAERDRLNALSNDPKFFKLMDLQERSNIEETTVRIALERGKRRYYLTSTLPKENDVIGLVMEENTRSILAPHLSPERISLATFPSDENGHYFEINPERATVSEMVFHIRHMPRRGQISIFLTGSVVGGTGNGMFLDMSAMIHDIFDGEWPAPKIYGAIVLPSAFKRVVYNKNARANAYAAIKEIDYFMSGNPFTAIYPGGKKVRIENRLFSDGCLYLLDAENLNGNILQDRDQVQELTGQFIISMVASHVGGAIEERMVNDSTRASIYLPREDGEPKRRASYSSFGVSRVRYPVPEMREIGFCLAALRIIRRFQQPVAEALLIESFGDTQRGIVRSLRLNCRLIFERLYPDYQADWKGEFHGYRDRLRRSLQKGDHGETLSILRSLRRDFGRAEMENHKERLMRRMQSRTTLELEKVHEILTKITYDVIGDSSKGFPFFRSLMQLLNERLEHYEKTYYLNRTRLNYYAESEIETLLNDLESKLDAQRADAIFQMIRINHLQLIHEALLDAAEEYVRNFKALVYNVRNDLVAPLEERLGALSQELHDTVQQDHFNLLQKINPLYFYIVNKKEIQSFINNYFGSRLSIDDLSREVNFLKLDRGDDHIQLAYAYLVGKHGIAVLEKSNDEVNVLLDRELGSDFRQLKIDEARERIENRQKESNLTFSEATHNRIGIDILRSGLFQLIRSRFAGFSFESIDIQSILRERKIRLKNLLERLDRFSRPYIAVELHGLEAMEYFRTVSQFPLNIFEQGDNPSGGAGNDLPSRMDHYRKRETAEPHISVECFEAPMLCKPYEILSIGMVMGFPLYRVVSLIQSMEDYHEVMGEREHPLHLFNHPSLNARYFPDPFRHHNYLNPVELWNGLLHFALIKQQSDNLYHYAETLHDELRRIVAGVEYRRSIEKLINESERAGKVEDLNEKNYAKLLSSLGILRRTKDGRIGFRRDYDLVVRDLLDGDETENKARQSKMSKDAWIEKNIPSPLFNSLGELIAFLQRNQTIWGFLNNDIRRIFRQTRGMERSGAAIELPTAKVAAVKLSTFRDELDFYRYYDLEGSIEWQEFLKNRLIQAIDEKVRYFVRPDDPTLPDRARIDQWLGELDGKIPFVVAWEIRVKHRLLR